MQPHNAALAGAVGSAGITVADAMNGANWQTIALNAALTLISAGVSAFLKSRQAKASANEKKGGK